MATYSRAPWKLFLLTGLVLALIEDIALAADTWALIFWL